MINIQKLMWIHIAKQLRKQQKKANKNKKENKKKLAGISN